jgi:hypothetical protein
VSLVLVLGLAFATIPSLTGAQSPATGHAEVIAQGTAWLPAAPATWWVGWHTEPPPVSGASPYRNLGFVLGESGTTTIVTDGALGRQLVWLDPGEALFVQADTFQERFSTGATASYFSLDLLPATAPDPLAQPIGGSIVPNGEIHELSLLRDVLVPGETGTIPSSPYSVLMVVTAGAVAVSPPTGDPFLLGAGEGATVDANAVVAGASDEPAAYVAAVLTTRPEQAPRAGAADLGLWVSHCPPGVTAQPVMTNRGCVIGDPLASGLDVRITGPTLATPLTLANSGPGDAGARVWADVPFGTYTLTATLPPDAVGYALRPTVESLVINRLPDGTGYTFTIDGTLFDPRSDYQRVNLDVYLLYP